MARPAPTPDHDSSESPRSISPRPSLPNGRAVLGALLVTVAAVGAFVSATSGRGDPDTLWVVVRRAVDAGSSIESADVTTRAIDLPSDVAANALSATSPVDGRVALVDLRPGDLIRDDDLDDPGTSLSDLPSRHELAVPVERDRLDLDLVPGDRVTILVSLTVDGRAATLVATEDAPVVRWSSADERIGHSGGGVLTVALADADSVMELTHLLSQGQSSIVRTTRAVNDSYPPRYPVS